MVDPSFLSLWSEGRKLTSKVPGTSVGWGGSSCRYRIKLRGPGNCKYSLRMRRTAAWSGDKVREGKTSRRSLPWPVVLSFTGLPRYLARMANSERWSKTRHGPGILSRRLNASLDKTRAKQKSWVGPQQTFKILKRVCASRKISLSSFLITAGNPNNIIKIYL